MDSSPQSPEIEVFCDGESTKVTKYHRVSESPKDDAVTTLLSDRNCNLAGSRSDVLKSPNDSVFLHMDDIPQIREELADIYSCTKPDSCSVTVDMEHSCGDMISSPAQNSGEETLGKKFLRTLSGKTRKKSRDMDKSPEEMSVLHLIT
ncbi:unnamed protein product [Ranitomeya imitator]|uniref:Uncharacterized protein n=2 Tax=Ranitomeya imitator TaxID=111125 RepID=A0ABN9LY77_9NEOB|nr:unnamed protein product [Ranitomeya imitator]